MSELGSKTAPGEQRPGELYRRESWFSAEEEKSIPSYEYWNDAESEESKEWNVSQGDFSRMEEYLERNGLWRQLEGLIGLLDRPLAGRGLSLASGTCWLEARLLNRIPTIQSIECVELSRHRIFALAPLVLQHYGVDASRIKLCWGNFSKLKLRDGEIDFVVMCQAFHHAFEPVLLLNEVRRVLSPQGQIVILGEHYFGMGRRADKAARHIAKWALNWHGYRAGAPLIPRFSNLFPGDPIKGDHHYSPSQYQRMFATAGLRSRHRTDGNSGLQGFVLTPCTGVSAAS